MQRKAIEAAQTARTFLPAAAAAVEVAVDLAESLKGPEDKSTSVRSSTAGTSQDRRTHATAIKAAIVTVETVQRSSEANEAAADRLRTSKAHLCAQLANQRREPKALEMSGALYMLRGDGDVGEAETQFTHDGQTLASFNAGFSVFQRRLQGPRTTCLRH